VQITEEVSDHVIPPHVGFFEGSACFDTTTGKMATLGGRGLDLLAATREEDVQMLQFI